MLTLEEKKEKDKEEIAGNYLKFISDKNFACVAAKAAVAKNQVHTFVADHIACPHNDLEILDFIYRFVDVYRSSEELYHTAAVIFKSPTDVSDQMFDMLMWQRLQSLSTLDSRKYKYDPRVDADPASPDFSYSLKEESFFIIGLHSASPRLTRRFDYPALVFNPHMQFEKLRETGKYQNLQQAVRKRDTKVAGSINPMLTNFGEESEVYQYSGSQYGSEWKCPLKINHQV